MAYRYVVGWSVLFRPYSGRSCHRLMTTLKSLVTPSVTRDAVRATEVANDNIVIASGLLCWKLHYDAAREWKGFEIDFDTWLVG